MFEFCLLGTFGLNPPSGGPLVWLAVNTAGFEVTEATWIFTNFRFFKTQNTRKRMQESLEKFLNALNLTKV